MTRMTRSIAELREVSDAQLIAEHDELTKHIVHSTDFYLNELQRRTAERATRKIVRLTWAIAAMTLVILLCTVAQFVFGR
jgi:nitrate/nitrite-specific signal transduction histidine kinase